MTTEQSTVARDYALDGVVPSLVVRPASVEDLASTLAGAAGENLAVVPWGSGVRQGLGNPPERYDMALDLGALDAIVEYKPADLTVTVQAGITLERLASTLAEHGQAVALESPLPGRATVGGTLAAGLGGPLSHSYGGSRERLIGLRVALVDGIVAHGGGRVVKNVAGYDLPRLFAGSLGTLGVITEASFKLVALPAVAATVIVRPASVAAAFDLTRDLQIRSLPLRALEVGTAAGEILVAVDCSARASVVDRLQREVGEAAGDAPVEMLSGDEHGAFWREWQDAGLAPGASRATIIRAAVPAATVLRLVESGVGPGVDFQARPATGVVRVLIPEAEDPAGAIAALRGAAHRNGGHAIVEHGAAAARRAAGAWDGDAPDETMRRLKSAFDPGRTLNPGRFVGGL